MSFWPGCCSQSPALCLLLGGWGVGALVGPSFFLSSLSRPPPPPSRCARPALAWIWPAQSWRTGSGGQSARKRGPSSSRRRSGNELPLVDLWLELLDVAWAGGAPTSSCFRVWCMLPLFQPGPRTDGLLAQHCILQSKCNLSAMPFAGSGAARKTVTPERRTGRGSCCGQGSGGGSRATAQRSRGEAARRCATRRAVSCGRRATFYCCF